MIIDICSRALAFYNYQISQELYYRISVQQLMEQKLDEQHDTIQHAARDYHRSLKGKSAYISQLIISLSLLCYSGTGQGSKYVKKMNTTELVLYSLLLFCI